MINPDKVIYRAATIFAKVDSVFALINKENYRKILAKIDAKKISRTIDYLKSYPYLKKMSHKVLNALPQKMSSVEYHVNQVIF
jgi:hypothetical protein